MNPTTQQDSLELTPSVYFAEILVQCELEHAWRVLLDFEVWNPTFVGSRVTPVAGNARSEGERLLISKTYSDPKGERFPEYYADTVKVVPSRRIVWYCYAKEGSSYHDQRDPFRNFVDFGLTEEPAGVRFAICYYEQNRQSGEVLSRERAFMQSALDQVVAAFREYCMQDGGDFRDDPRAPKAEKSSGSTT